MIEVLHLGMDTTHDGSFEVDRPNGRPVYLLLLVKTPALFLVNGRWTETAPDTAVIFKPGQMHRYRAVGDTYCNDWIHLQSNIVVPGEQFPFGCPVTLHKPGDYYNLFRLIHNEFYSVSHHRNLILNNLMAALLDKIADESNEKAYPDIFYALTELREQIYQSPGNDWKIPDMASELNISVGYLHSLYRHYFSTSCINDVIQSRIQYACELLAFNNKPLEEIAEMCGYRSVEHFIRQFKSTMGVTPGKYRSRW